MNKKAFLLVDSLACLLIVVGITSICFFTYNQVEKHDEVYKMYYEKTSEKYKDFYRSLPECVKCVIETEDTEEDF